MEEAAKRLSIRAEQDEFIEDFNSLGDWMTQYQCLLELTADMEKMQEADKNPETLITGCQAKLWVKTSFTDGVIRVLADSEALVVKGITAVIAALFDGRTPEEVLAAKIDFIEKTSLKDQISVDRFRGMQSVIRRIQAEAAGYLCMSA